MVALKSECESAVSWVAAQNQATPARSLQVGYNGTCGDPGWGSVPLGCSVAQLQGDWTAHWKESGVNCNNHYQLVCSGAPASCEDLGHTTSGVYTIYTVGGPRQVKCKYADGRMWTLVYKIAGHSTMKTDEAQNVTALTESITTSHSGKLSQAEIKELCSEQFWLTQNETSANVYCAFDNISDYADGNSTSKKCSQTFSPLWANDVFPVTSGNTSSEGFSSGTIITQLAYTPVCTNDLPGYSFRSYGYYSTGFIQNGNANSNQECADKCTADAACVAFSRWSTACYKYHAGHSTTHASTSQNEYLQMDRCQSTTHLHLHLPVALYILCFLLYSLLFMLPGSLCAGTLPLYFFPPSCAPSSSNCPLLPPSHFNSYLPLPFYAALRFWCEASWFRMPYHLHCHHSFACRRCCKICKSPRRHLSKHRGRAH